MASVCIERMMHSSSTILAVCGHNSVIQCWTVLSELKLRSHDWETLLTRSHSRQSLPLTDAFGQFSSLQFLQFGLVIQQFKVRGSIERGK